MAPKHATGRVPSAEPEPLTEKDIDTLKQMLLRKRDDLTGQISKLKNDAVDGRDSTNWEEDGTDAFDREFAFKMAGSRNEMITQIDEALLKTLEKTYGVCEACNKKIGRARMNVLPFCKTCVDCQTQSEQGRVPSRVRLPG